MTTQELSELKAKVATCCRMLYHTGLAPDYQGHASARVPGKDLVLIKARGDIAGSLGDTRPEHIVTVDLERQLLEGAPGLAQPWETALHTEIYKARPDVGAVIHTHQLMTMAFGLAGQDILPVWGQWKPALVAEPMPTFDSPDLVDTPEVGAAVARALGTHWACHLRAHGVVIAGETIEDAFENAISLEKLATLQYMAMQIGTPRPFSKEHLERNKTHRFSAMPTWNFYARQVPLSE
ncbi:MAG: class II aldolase/adducin family protein [Chloroflexi bacterium]|nr:class II aldolase/adducin family protein [Chloroflexota bacterium]